MATAEDSQRAFERLRKAYEAKRNPCRHPHLKFIDGGQYLQCIDCGQRYFKSLKDHNLPGFPDWTGQFDGFFEHDKRSDPFSITKPKTKSPKPTSPKKTKKQ